MKTLLICILSLLCIGVLIGVWRAKQTPPEVIKIYKAAHYEPQSTRARVPLNVHAPATERVAKTEGTEYSDDFQTDHVLSEFSAEFIPEEDEFGEWSTSLDPERSAEVFSGKREDIAEPETDTTAEIPYSELVKRVKEAYELEDVLNDYGVFLDEWGNGYCSKCTRMDFQLMKSVKTGKYEFWCCMACKDGAYNVVEFVAWREGWNDTEAARYLAQRAGLLE